MMKEAEKLALWTEKSSVPLNVLRIFLLLYPIFLFYGALFPFQQWELPSRPMLTILIFEWINHIFLFDIIQNLILFLPLGLLAGTYLALQKKRLKYIFLLPTLLSFLLSLFVELVQTYNPARIPSLLDVILNTSSGFLGVLLSLFLIKPYFNFLYEIKNALQLGSKSNIWPYVGISVWIGWALYLFAPFLPTLHPHQLLANVSPLILFVKGEGSFSFEKLCLHLLQGTMIYFSGKLFLKPERFTTALGIFVPLVLLGKIIIIGDALTSEIVLGCGGSIVILSCIQKAIEATLGKVRLHRRIEA